MTNLLQDGATWLGGQLKDSAGRSVSIVQGSLRVSGLTASVYQHEYPVLNREGFLTQVRAYDWTFTAADIVSGSSVVALRKGAVITETLNGVEHKYEAMEVGDMPAVEDKDTSGILLTVHTRRISDG